MANLVKLSKFVSKLLRHEPEKYSLVLDEQGFTDLSALWQQIEKNFKQRYSYEDFERMLASDGGKQRFEVRDGRIRAMYGHSTKNEINYEAVTPPEILYHGTVDRALPAIREHGLKGMRRQYVHLSTHTDRANVVANRHGQALLLKIHALKAHEAGIVFYNPEPQHFLAKHIPPEFIEFP